MLQLHSARLVEQDSRLENRYDKILLHHPQTLGAVHALMNG